MLDPLIFAELEAMSGEQINCDLFADKHKAQVPRFFTKEDDCFSKPWCHMACWVNPPFTNECIVATFKRAELA